MAQTFQWNLESGYLDSNSFKDVRTIIHLAGAGIADKRWSKKRKSILIDSRVNSTRLLFDALKKERSKVTTFISASAIGYYGFGNEHQIFAETHAPGKDFLAGVTQQWENEVVRVSELGIREVRLRTGVVLSKQGGALPKMAEPVKWGIGSPLGSGNQILSWIHIDDLCEMFIQSIENENMHGPYNAVSPNPISNRELTHQIANVLHRPLWLPAVPGFILKLMLGEMAEIVLNGNKVSAEKILATGFRFKFENLEKALVQIYAKD